MNGLIQVFYWSLYKSCGKLRIFNINILLRTWWHLKYEFRMVKLFHLLLVVLPYQRVRIKYVHKTRNEIAVSNIVLYFTFCNTCYQHQWLFKSKYYAWVWWEMNYRIFSFDLSFERCITRGWHVSVENHSTGNVM